MEEEFLLATRDLQEKDIILIYYFEIMVLKVVIRGSEN